jgi:hypothetical protein
MRKGFAFLLVTIVILFFTSCLSSTHKLFESTKDRFMNDYQKAIGSDNLDTLLSFINQYENIGIVNSDHEITDLYGAVVARYDGILWREANELFTIESFNHYFENTIKNVYGSQARNAILDIQNYNEIEKQNTIEGYQNYIERNKNYGYRTVLVERAKKEIESLQKNKEYQDKIARESNLIIENDKANLKNIYLLQSNQKKNALAKISSQIQLNKYLSYKLKLNYLTTLTYFESLSLIDIIAPMIDTPTFKKVDTVVEGDTITVKIDDFEMDKEISFGVSPDKRVTLIKTMFISPDTYEIKGTALLADAELWLTILFANVARANDLVDNGQYTGK